MIRLIKSNRAWNGTCPVVISSKLSSTKRSEQSLKYAILPKTQLEAEDHLCLKDT